MIDDPSADADSEKLLLRNERLSPVVREEKKKRGKATENQQRHHAKNLRQLGIKEETGGPGFII